MIWCVAGIVHRWCGRCRRRLDQLGGVGFIVYMLHGGIIKR